MTDTPSIFHGLDHHRFMGLAIDQARLNLSAPFGAVIVHGPTGEVLAEGTNASKSDCTQHGEIAAIQDLEAKKPPHARDELVLYTTAEPCPMCAAAIVWCGIGGVVYATDVDTLKRAGFRQFDISAEALTAQGPHPVAYFGGIRADETDLLFEVALKRGSDD